MDHNQNNNKPRNTVQDVIRSARDQASNANVFDEHSNSTSVIPSKDGENVAPNSKNSNRPPHFVPSMNANENDNSQNPEDSTMTNDLGAEGKNDIKQYRAPSKPRRPVVTLGEMVRRHDFRGLDKYATPFLVEKLNYERGKDVASIALGGNPHHRAIIKPTFSRNPVRPKLVGDRYYNEAQDGANNNNNNNNKNRGYGFGASPSRVIDIARMGDVSQYNHAGRAPKQSAYFPVKGNFPEQPPADLNHLVPPPQDLARHLFSAINRSGLASIGISQDAVRMLWPGFSDSSMVDRAFAATLKRREGSNEISNNAMRFEGFFPMLRCVAFMNNMNPLFKMMNRDLGDRISKDEFLAFAPQLRLKEPESEFHEIDEDNEGHITIEQLCCFLAENPARYADLEVNPLMALQNAGDKSTRKKNRLGKLNKQHAQTLAASQAAVEPTSLANSRTALMEDLERDEEGQKHNKRAPSEDKASARSAPVSAGRPKKHEQQPPLQSHTPRHTRVAQRRAQREAERLERLRALADASDERVNELRRKKEQEERERAEAARLAALAAQEAHMALSHQLEEEERLRLAEEAMELERRQRERELADQKRREAYARGQAEREAMLAAQAEKLAAERAKAEEEARARREAALKAKREKEEAERQKKEQEEAEKKRQAELDRKRREKQMEERKKRAEEAAKARAEKEAREKAEREEAAKRRAEEDRLKKEKAEQEKAEKEAKKKAELEKRKREEAERKAREMEAARKKAEEEEEARKKAEEEEAARKEQERQEAEEKAKRDAEEAAKKKAEEDEKKQLEESKRASEDAAAIKIQGAARQRMARGRLADLRKQRADEEAELERQAAEAEEAERKKAEEDEAARQKAEEDAIAAAAAAEAERQRKEAEAEEEEAARKQAEEEEAARLKAEEEEAARIKAEEEEAARQKQAEEEEAARIKAEEEEAARLKAEEEEAARIKAEEEDAARIKAEEEEAARKKAEEEEAARKKAEEEEAARKKAEEEEAARIKAEEEEAARIKAEEEEAARKKAEEEEAARIKAEEEEAARIKAEEEEAARKQAEEEEAARVKAEEEEAARKKAEEEEAARKKAEEEEAARIKAEEEEAARKKAEEEAAAAAAAAEAERKAAAEKAIADAKAKKEAEEAARKKAEEEARLAAEKAAAEKEAARKQAIRDRFMEPREKVQPHHLIMSTEKRFFSDLFEYVSDFREAPEDGVSEEEFKTKAINIKWPGHTAKSAVERSWVYCDKNAKRRIPTHEEFMSALQFVVYANNLQPLFENVDTNGTGTLDKEEFDACASQFEIEDSETAFADMIKYINEHLKMSLPADSDSIPFDLYCYWLSREKPFFDVEVEVEEVAVPDNGDGDNDGSANDASFTGTFEVAKSRRQWKTQPPCDLDNLELPHDSSLLNDLWYHLDKDETDFINLDQFSTACSELWPGFANKSAANSAFQSVHQPENGDVIMRKRFARALQYVVYANNLYSLFDEVDVDGNKRVDKAEFVAIAEQFQLDDADAAFDEMDVEKKGHVTFEQFCEWVTNHKEEIERANDDGQDGDMDSPGNTIVAK